MLSHERIQDVKVEVKSLVNTHIIYRSEVTNAKRKWTKEGQTKVVPLEEVKEVCQTNGGLRLFKNFLEISRVVDPKNEATVEDVLSLLEIADEKPLSNIEVVKAIRGSKDKLAQLMKKSNQSTRERIAYKAVELKITDLDKIDVLEKYSGINVKERIEFAREEGTPTPSQEQVPTETEVEEEIEEKETQVEEG